VVLLCRNVADISEEGKGKRMDVNARRIAL
jgi:hypothetical protein